MVESDMRLLKIALNAQNLIPSQTDGIDINVLIDDVWEIIKEEMDFNREVHNCKLFVSETAVIALNFLNLSGTDDMPGNKTHYNQNRLPHNQF